ncbi:hypothetical protein ABZU88_10870 [Streptomyces sp. NPDC005245]|uniref:hypothetical protein n=1 Tax=Streptomyces sp. NPDC005245 TaxID=3157029 RepID=UPI0033A45BA3
MSTGAGGGLASSQHGPDTRPRSTYASETSASESGAAARPAAPAAVTPTLRRRRFVHGLVDATVGVLLPPLEFLLPAMVRALYA